MQLCWNERCASLSGNQVYQAYTLHQKLHQYTHTGILDNSRYGFICVVLLLRNARKCLIIPDNSGFLSESPRLRQSALPTLRAKKQNLQRSRKKKKLQTFQKLLQSRFLKNRLILKRSANRTSEPLKLKRVKLFRSQRNFCASLLMTEPARTAQY